MTFDKNAWDRNDATQRRARAVAYLGGVCARCGTTEHLEFDHRDASQKSYAIGANLNRRWETLVQELDKCQLLCHRCHLGKTAEAGDNTGGGWNRLAPDEIPHGTNTGYTYWKCRCEPCRQARYEARVRYGDIPGTGKRRGAYQKRSYGETEIMTDYESVVGGSSPPGSTKGD